jgi:hypothetical protein
MPNRIFAIRYNNVDSLVHLFFTEEHLTLTLLNKELAEEVGFNSFTIDQSGNLVNSLSQHAIETTAALELYNALLSAEGEYLKSIQFGNSAPQFAKAG